ncbi:hypothetical protein L596_025526 [Steinernema carpocapsae]|uniref:Uncharacterized protein n=1 Tax=Steinernema carpocapsae TaxID=34508 RepID=A0A4V6XVS1_STECR|nr:hypothetical protein L596_025526 [Steinernema carpocapsae]
MSSKKNSKKRSKNPFVNDPEAPNSSGTPEEDSKVAGTDNEFRDVERFMPSFSKTSSGLSNSEKKEAKKVAFLERMTRKNGSDPPPSTPQNVFVNREEGTPLEANHREKNLRKQRSKEELNNPHLLSNLNLPPSEEINQRKFESAAVLRQGTPRGGTQGKDGVKNPHLLSSLNLPPTERTNNKKFESAILVDPVEANAKVVAKPKTSNKSKKDALEVCSTQASVKDEDLLNRLTGRDQKTTPHVPRDFSTWYKSEIFPDLVMLTFAYISSLAFLAILTAILFGTGLVF